MPPSSRSSGPPSLAPPRPKGVALTALRAFEAAARLQSFALAADELGVTPGAVAQQIKSLEAWVGVPLFVRQAQGVKLSALGQNVLSDFTEAFDRLGLAVQKLRVEASPREIRIAALPSVAQLWLSPRLPALRASAPQVSISVTALEHRPNLTREPYDLSLFFGPSVAGGQTIDLAPDVIFPVCAPLLAESLLSPADLQAYPCLQDSSWPHDWEIWSAELQRQGKEVIQPGGRGAVYSLYSLALEEAKNGAGVLMGHEVLVERHLAKGSLVAPFDLRVTLERSLTLEVAAAAADNPLVAQVIEGLKAGG
ncbi:LysR family transcriptional regulator [Rhodovibrionaceae bacterium A322]